MIISVLLSYDAMTYRSSESATLSYVATLTDDCDRSLSVIVSELAKI